MAFERGKSYTTLGGWEAEVIWVTDFGLYCVHKPGDSEESYPVWHRNDGTAHAILAVHAPPHYGGHPADLIAEASA